MHFLLALILLFTGCSSPSHDVTLRIAYDPDWYGVEVDKERQNVSFYTQELMEIVAREHHLNISLAQGNWENLMPRLNEGEYDAVLTTYEPRRSRESIYTFSDPYLLTGPVLVRKKDAPHKIKIAAVEEESHHERLIEKKSKWVIKHYENVIAGFEGLIDGHYDVILVDSQRAHLYLQNTLYRNQLEITSEPLDQEGIRLVTLKKKQTKLQKAFEDVLKSENLNAMRKKWRLY